MVIMANMVKYNNRGEGKYVELALYVYKFYKSSLQNCQKFSVIINLTVDSQVEVGKHKSQVGGVCQKTEKLKRKQGRGPK